MITLAITVGLLLLACIALVVIGCRAILTLCRQLERDRGRGYSMEPQGPTYEQRRCPAWIRDTRRAAK